MGGGGGPQEVRCPLHVTAGSGRCAIAAVPGAGKAPAGWHPAVVMQHVMQRILHLATKHSFQYLLIHTRFAFLMHSCRFKRSM